MKIKNMFLLLIAGVLLIISTQNTQEVEVRYLFWDTKISLIFLIYTMLSVGVVAGMVYTSFRRVSKEKIMKKKMKMMEIDKITSRKIS